MKKILVLLLAAALAASCTACGTGDAQSTADNQSTAADGQSTAADEQSAESDEQSADADGESSDAETAAVTPLELMTTVWNSYGEDEKFAVIGGDLSEEHVTEGAPGVYSTEDTEVMDNALGYPAASADLIDEAASLTHMLNANTFTGSAYHLVNAEDIGTAADAIHENIKNRQWICGFPEQLVIASAGGNVVLLYGTEDLVSAFRDKLTAAYPETAVLYDEPV